jgi:mannosyltransferase
MTSPSGPPAVGETAGDDAASGQSRQNGYVAATHVAEGTEGANGSGDSENAHQIESSASAESAAPSPVASNGDSPNPAPASPAAGAGPAQGVSPEPAPASASGPDQEQPATTPDAGAGAAPAGAVRTYDRGPVWALLLPPLVGLALGLWGITTPSYWRDEAATIAAVRRPFPDLIHMLGNVDAVHSAYYIFMWPLVHLFGTGAFVMRFPTVIAAAVTAAIVAAIGRRLISPWVGLAAGLLFAVLPVATRYGQEARPYAIVVGLAALASYLLIRVLMADPVGRRKWLIGYAVGLAALGIANIFGLLLIPAHAITVALDIRRRGRGADSRKLAVGWLVAGVVGVVCASPLLILGFQQRGQVAWIANNQSSSGLITLVTLTGSSLITLAIMGIVAIALILSSEAAGAPARRAAWRWPMTELSLPWMLVPPALLLGASVISPIYTSRYVLMCIPALALLGGMAIVALGRVAGPVALVLVVLAGLSTQIIQRQPYGHFDNVRALDQIVAANARPGDVVLYTNPNAESFAAAYPAGLGKLPNIQTKEAADPSGTLAGTPVEAATLKKRLAHASRVWVVEINHCLSEPQLLNLSGVQQGAALSGVPLQFVRIWHERGDWLFLYKHGQGNQATTTACNGAP